MARNRLQLVSDNRLLLLDDRLEGHTTPAPIVFGSDSWYAWLADEQHRSFSFRSHMGTFTVRHERKRYGWYWYVYRKHEGKLHKAYLGKTQHLTLEQLTTVAATLISQDITNHNPVAYMLEHTESSAQGLSHPKDDRTGRPRRLLHLVTSDIPSAISPLKTIDVSPNNLPIQPNPLLGREKELAAIQLLLCRDDVHLVTLTGVGGTGKTRLALQVATELLGTFADGIYFVSLAPISDPGLVVPAIAQTLGIREGNNQSLLETLKEELQPRQLLLLLDNFEQVASAAPVVADLLANCALLKVLVTSRMVLHIRAEHEFGVLPLGLPNLIHLPESQFLTQYAAIALFIQRAQVVNPDFQLSPANAPVVAEICARLDGLPLAIELAAARIKLLSPSALLARLEHRLHVLTSGAQDAPLRQRTLRDTLAWSYDLLDAQEQRLFSWLSVFVGGCTLEASEAVCAQLVSPDGDNSRSVLDGVSLLIDKSLLQTRQQSGEESRLLMLETIREYGLERLASSGELEHARTAHAQYYFALVKQAEPELMWGPLQIEWMNRLEPERDNLRAVLRRLVERGDAREEGDSSENKQRIESREMALHLASVLEEFWAVRGPVSEGRYWLERALAVSMEIRTSERADALWALGRITILQGDYARAEALAQEQLVLSRELGDIVELDRAHFRLGHVASKRDNLTVARALFEECIVLRRKLGDNKGLGWALANMVVTTCRQGEYSKARALAEEALALWRDLGNTYGFSMRS